MAESQKLEFIAYYDTEYTGLEVPIVPAFSRRAWMSFMNDHPYRCLPLTMANQMGWFLLNPIGFVAEWEDETEDAQITLAFDEPLPEQHRMYTPNSFGNGILTFKVPYVFRTPPGYNLLVRGPVNSPKDGIQSLEGLVESDWIEASFTMNWKFTRAHHPVHFEKGEPFAMITPVRRGEVEQFAPRVQALQENPALSEAFFFWRGKRKKAIRNQALRESLAVALKRPRTIKYDLDYLRGQSASGDRKFPQHQTRLKLKPFKEAWQKQFNQRSGDAPTVIPDPETQE